MSDFNNFLHKRYKTIIVDIDNCFTDSRACLDYKSFEEFNKNIQILAKPNLRFIKKLIDFTKIYNYYIHFVTSRIETLRDCTANQIYEYSNHYFRTKNFIVSSETKISFSEQNCSLYMRAYNDYRTSELVKIDIIKKIEKDFVIDCIIDDLKTNVDYFRKAGYNVIQYDIDNNSYSETPIDIVIEL